jgi:serine/threonine-protein kinase ULK4
MEKYHIYEEIGKGEFSQVFKGREKKKIEYVAIKRIEKSVMNKVGDLELGITLLS